MLNINSLSSSSKAYSFNNPDRPSCNQITMDIQSVQNVSGKRITIRNLPHYVVGEIGKYLDIKSIQNLNKADVCWKIDPVSNQIRKYSDQIKKLRQWENECPKETAENRKLALTKIIDCIKKENPVLNLSYLNLTGLPDLRSFGFITKIIYEGNDRQPMFECFDRDDNAFFKFKLKQSSPLPNRIKEIITDYDGETFIFPNNPSKATLPPEAVFWKDLHVYMCFKNIRDIDDTFVDENVFMRLALSNKKT